MREVDVVGIRFEEPEYAPVLVLKERDGGRYVPIWIGAAEAAAISLQQQGVRPERPLTHDLLATLLETFSHPLERVEIVGVSEGTFLAEMVFDAGRRVSARPSDAVAVALRTSSPVLVSREVLDEVGLSLAEGGEEEVEAFREFLDQVSADDFLEGDGPEEPGGSTS
ncbi:MAG TPA: bifunctional nuclease family protein [Actinomycetales bacterium]|nr:bifunctional nuclease family protein [Actinomycetales bacterium]